MSKNETLEHEWVILTHDYAQLPVRYLAAQMPFRQFAPNTCHNAARIKGKPVQLMDGVKQKPTRACKRPYAEQRLFPGRINMVNPGNDPIRGALIHVELFDKGRNTGNELHGARGRADNRNTLSLEAVVPVPSCRMQQASLIGIHTRKIGIFRLT